MIVKTAAAILLFLAIIVIESSPVSSEFLRYIAVDVTLIYGTKLNAWCGLSTLMLLNIKHTCMPSSYNTVVTATSLSRDRNK